MKKKFTVFAFFSLLTIGIIYSINSRPFYQKAAFFGTEVSVKFYGNYFAAQRTSKELFKWLEKLHNTVNIFDVQSELSRLNDLASEAPFVCSDMLWDALQCGRYGYEVSNGYFDITSGALMRLWGFHNKRETLPSEKSIKEVLDYVGLGKVKFDDKAKSVFFTKDKMALDLGGFIKGYALDYGKALAEKNGIKSGLLDFGGNIYCFPKPPPGKKAYQLGIRGANGIGTHEVFEGSDFFTATSGDYERFRIIENRKFAHIINPLTGYPVTDRASVVVVTQTGIDSDILSTAIFVGGSEFGRKLAKERFPKLQFVVVNHKPGRRFIYDHFGTIWKKN